MDQIIIKNRLDDYVVNPDALTVIVPDVLPKRFTLQYHEFSPACVIPPVWFNETEHGYLADNFDYPSQREQTEMVIDTNKGLFLVKGVVNRHLFLAEHIIPLS